MRILTFLVLLVFTSSIQAQGFLDSIRRRVTDTVDNAVDEVRSITNQEIGDVNQDVNESTDGLVDEVIPEVPPTVGSSSAAILTPGGTASAQPVSGDPGRLPEPLSWGTPSGNDLRAIDQVIQGLRLGMPEIYVDEILRERGYERSQLHHYTRQQTTDDGRLIRTQRIRYLTVEPSSAFIEELDDGELKDMVLAAQRLVDANQQTASNPEPGLREQRRTRTSRTAGQSVSGTSAPRNLQLVYVISYEQIFNQEVMQFDLEATMEQVRATFGPSTFPDDQLRSGMAFRTSPGTTLIYHDASLLSPDYRTSLVESVPELRLGHTEAVYNALRVPCGGPENPWGAPGGGGCLTGWSDAFANDFQRQMELNRAILSPYMRIGAARSGAGIETRLEWSYLQSERQMRESNAEKVARDNAPAAELDF